MSNHTISTDGRKSTPSQFTPEQKLQFIGKLARLYRKFRDEEYYAAMNARDSRAWSEQELYYMKARRRADARMTRVYKCILALTAPAGGAE